MGNLESHFTEICEHIICTPSRLSGWAVFVTFVAETMVS